MNQRERLTQRKTHQKRGILIRAGVWSGSLVWAALLVLLISTPVIAAPGDESPDGVWRQEDRVFTPVSIKSLTVAHPSQYSVFSLNPVVLDGILASAPAEYTKGQDEILTLPKPDGSYERFRIFESPILSEALQAGNPDIKTYMGQGIDDPSATVRFDLTLFGFRAMIWSASGTRLVDPLNLGKTDYYMSYWKRDVPSPNDFVCGVTGDGLQTEIKGATALAASGDKLTTYRMVVTCTGEYTEYWADKAGATTRADSIAAALAQITTTFNRVNGIYEKDVAVRFNIVRTLIFVHSGSDRFPTGVSVGELNDTNVVVSSDSVGGGNFDIGHILSQGGSGGVAGLGVVCETYKAWGGTSRGNPSGDAFDVDYVAHEVGHQMGGSHTFNGTTGSCGGGNRSAGNAYEPGSGSTIMAYAGICGAEDLQPHSDPYFHVRSLKQIIAERDGSGCGTVTATGNNPPTADAQVNYTIPTGTPFKLTGAGSDPDGDPLTYCWEQYDAGDPTPPLNWDNGPLFRSFNPTTSPSRTFPKLSDILSGTTSTWERLPNSNRDMTFKLTVRDNRAGGGGVDWDEMTVTAAGDPFYVTYPNGGETLPSGCPITVTWVVGGGDIADDVNIWLSTDGGLTLSQLLATTANDGSAEVTLPCSGTTSARIMIAAVGNIFFDYSNGNFTIQNNGPAHVSSYINGGSVDDNCRRVVEFGAEFSDDCSLLSGDVGVTVSLPSGGATMGSPTVSVVQTTPTLVTITGSVLVSDLTASPVTVRVDFEVEDGCGNDFSTHISTTVYDDTDPVISCPGDLVFECDAIGDFGTPIATDNCDLDPTVTLITRDSVPGDCPQEYALTLTYRARDFANNTATCQQTITVEDTTDPEISCPDTLEFVFTSPTQAEITFDVTATDNCSDDPLITCDSASGSVFDLGLHTITCRVDDGCGNMDSCAFSFRLVPLDIKPGSCPNALNVRAKGPGMITSAGVGIPSASVFPVAILGSADFDVSTIDLASLRLQGLEPIRTGLADVAAPVTDDPSQGCECTTEGPDGFTDLTMKFDKRNIIGMLGDVVDGEEVMLQLTGALLDGTPIAGGDCVLIRAEKQITINGSITTAGAGVEFATSSYPNPFNASTTISYRLTETSPVTLTIYNILGQQVTELINESQPAGDHSVTWYGRDASGREVASGMYFYRLQAGEHSLTRKMMMLK